MFTDYYHIGYLTDDIAAAVAFYCQTLRAELVAEKLSPDGKTKMAFLKVGVTEIELIEAPDRVRAAGKGSIVLDHIGYCVPDVDAAVAELRAKGIGFATEAPYTNSLGDRLIYVDESTTHGVRFHLSQRM